MNVQAFTIGRTTSYDAALAAATDDDPIYKLGKHEDYEGGAVWRTAAEAKEFIVLSDYWPSHWDRDDFSVYQLELPTGWDTDVSSTPHPSDGVYRLLNNAIVLAYS